MYQGSHRKSLSTNSTHPKISTKKQLTRHVRRKVKYARFNKTEILKGGSHRLHRLVTPSNTDIGDTFLLGIISDNSVKAL